MKGDAYRLARRAEAKAKANLRKCCTAADPASLVIDLEHTEAQTKAILPY